jgi:pyruvate,water dikinase
VTDVGGILAHGSIVAREYGIPAVMGTGNATQRIAEGEQVTVDGDHGTVTLVDGGPEAPAARPSPQPRAAAGAWSTAAPVAAAVVVAGMAIGAIWLRMRRGRASGYQGERAGGWGT